MKMPERSIAKRKLPQRGIFSVAAPVRIGSSRCMSCPLAAGNSQEEALQSVVDTLISDTADDL